MFVEIAAEFARMLNMLVEMLAEFLLMFILALAILWEFIIPVARVSYTAKFCVSRLFIFVDTPAELVLIPLTLVEMPAVFVLTPVLLAKIPAEFVVIFDPLVLTCITIEAISSLVTTLAIAAELVETPAVF